MSVLRKIWDIYLLLLLISVIIGVPVGIRVYDHLVWQAKIPAEARVFTLTGHARKGWLRGEVHAYDAVSLWGDQDPFERPVLTVEKGDLVVLKLRSSDVVHGFSLKDFNIFITDGIQPGKSILISFRADKAGVFTFSCNAICGDNHQNMQGTLVVEA